MHSEQVTLTSIANSCSEFHTRSTVYWGFGGFRQLSGEFGGAFRLLVCAVWIS